jgi:hypothetical protein
MVREFGSWNCGLSRTIGRYMLYVGSVFEKRGKEGNRKESQQAAHKGRPWFDS